MFNIPRTPSYRKHRQNRAHPKASMKRGWPGLASTRLFDRLCDGNAIGGIHTGENFPENHEGC